MAVSALLYGPALLSLANKEIDFDSDGLKAMVCTSAYTPNLDTHRYKSSVTGEVASAGYTAGGATLTSVTVAYDAGTKSFILDAADIGWTGVTFAARYIVIYDSTPGTDATRPLIGLVDLGADVSPSNGPFNVNWNAAGILTVTRA